MANDNYIIGRLYVPIIMIILLMVMTYFHRHHVLKYLYSINIFCYLASVFSYFFLINHPVGEAFSQQWMNAIPFIWLAGIFFGGFLSIVSVVSFVVEQEKRHRWARVIIRIAKVTWIVLCIIGAYFFIQGVQSLKSG